MVDSIHITKEEVKLPLFSDNMILYIENPEDPTKSWLEFKNELNKIIVYKTNIQKWIIFIG